MKRVFEFTPKEVKQILRDYILQEEGISTEISFDVSEIYESIGDRRTGIYTVTKVVAKEEYYDDDEL